MTYTLQSYIGGRWQGREAGQVLRSAINGKPVASTHADPVDFGEAVRHARAVGVPNLLKLDFQQRAERLKALAKFLSERKETLYAVSAHTGGTLNELLTVYTIVNALTVNLPAVRSVQILVDGPCVGLTVVVIIRSQWTTPTIPRSAASVRGRDEG